jgi:uncharacterized membrane protein
MAAGNAIALLAVPEYATGSERVRRIYADPDPDAAWQAARSMGINYLFVDVAERTAYPAVAKFDAHPEHFERVFTDGDVSIYAVK